MFGKVRYFCHLLWPPIDHDTPLFSMNTCSIFVASAPLPAVRESPKAAIISISPGLSLCTEFGLSLLRFPGPFGSQKNLWDSGNGFWTFWNSMTILFNLLNQFESVSISYSVFIIPIVWLFSIGSTNEVEQGITQYTILWSVFLEICYIPVDIVLVR